MKELRIGIDLDGVVADFVKTFIQIVEKKYKINLKEIDIIYFDLGQVLGIIESERNKLVHNTLSEDLDLIENAKESLDQLKKHHKIYILTSRTKNFEVKTKHWLNSKDIQYDELITCGSMKKCKFNRKFDIFIEDKLEEAVQLSQVVETVILFDRPWNQSLDLGKLFFRFKNWSEILNFISDFG